MNSNSQLQNQSSSQFVNFDVKEQEFEDGEYGIPIAGRYEYPNGNMGSAIGDYKIPPSPGTFVLGAIDGVIQWIPTESCN